jgi:RNA polymerase sigma-70 factor (ECF subfamily)
MPGSFGHPVLRFLRALQPAEGAADAPDAYLLERFAIHRDEAAFAALLRRHGPMVLGVCARTLGDTPDAEDALQATFLVLARRAGSVGRPELLGNWLHGVACRVARKARAAAATRRRHEGRVRGGTGADPAEEVAWRDLRPVLDEELSRLPAKYRLPLVLCHLEGQTHEEVARRLGCPRETVTTRLVRARERLRRRLVRRGLTLSAGAGAALLTGDALTAAVPAALAETTVRSAAGFATGSGAAAGRVSAQVVALTEGVLQTMWLTKVKITAALVLAVAALAWGVGTLPRGTAAVDPVSTLNRHALAVDQVLAAAAPAPAGKDDEEHSSVKSSPPVVVKTVPAAGDTKVDAATTKEIRVTFSKDMADQSWSWSQISRESFPETTGKPRYDADKRTCILPVKLKPGKTYVLWLNPPKFQGFRDADGLPAVFYPLVFETKP